MPHDKPMKHAKSKAQQGFMGAELARERAGDPTQTGMSEDQLSEFASAKTKNLPEHASKKDEKRGMHSDAHSGHGRHKKGRGMGG